MKSILIVAGAAAVLAGCGGGGGNPGTCSGSPQYCAEVNAATTPAVAVAPPVVLPPPVSSASVAQQCVAPRPAGTFDPMTGQPYGDVQGTLTTEKAWIRSYVNETYLWYNEVVDADPALYVLGATVPFVDPANNSRTQTTLRTNTDVVTAYFNSQRSPLLTASGKPKDQFHFTVPTSEWTAMSTSGTSLGFGFRVALVATSPPRQAVIAYSEPGSPAALNGLNRGTQFVSVNGVDVASGDAAALNEGLFTPLAGKTYTFQVLDAGSSTPRNVVLTPGTVTSVPVQNARTLAAPFASVGYIQFNDHIATAESQLIAAVNQLKGSNGGAGVTDLILDLRYNGGGFLALASELAYMIAGPARTAGKSFETLTFNDKNPFRLTEAERRTPFYTQTQGYSTVAGQALPQLGLSRVFVITGADTCSASESIINGLRGAGVEVIQIGGTTCGKPYGFLPQDNCSTTYFSIQFKGVNQLGYGDYADGFVPGGTASAGNSVPGCAVADDFSRPLGDASEARIAAALRYRSNGSCGAAPVGLAAGSAATATDTPAPVLGGRSAIQENRFYRPAGRL